MRDVIFYVLIHPVSKEIRYVGKTVGPLSTRLNRHINNGKGHVGNWVSSTIKLGLRPIILEIGRCKEFENWQYIERFLISQYRYFGYRLCNICDGGIGGSGFKRTTEQNRSISKRNSIMVYSYNIKTKKISAYESFTEASNILGVSQSLISRSVNHGTLAAGHLFSRSKKFKQNKVSQAYRREIRCIKQDGSTEVFRSPHYAGKILGLCPTFIRKVANGIYSQYKGLRFEYSDKSLPGG